MNRLTVLSDCLLPISMPFLNSLAHFRLALASFPLRHLDFHHLAVSKLLREVRAACPPPRIDANCADPFLQARF